MAAGVALAVAARRVRRRRAAGEPAPLAAPFVVLWVARRRSSPGASACRLARRRVEPPLAAATRAPAAHRPAHLALLRDLRRAGGPRAAARQLPGRPEAGRRAPHLAHQHRPLPAVDGRGPRLRLARPARHRRAPRGDARHDRAPGAFPRPLLQLVRHPHLRPLEPRYVSSVDSGNLAGHLLALAQACEEMLRPPAALGGRGGGRRDALELMREAAAALPDDRRTQTVASRPARRRIEALASALDTVPSAPARMGALARRAGRPRAHAGRRRRHAGRRAWRRRGGGAAGVVPQPSPRPCRAVHVTWTRCCPGRVSRARTTPGIASSTPCPPRPRCRTAARLRSPSWRGTPETPNPARSSGASSAPRMTAARSSGACSPSPGARASSSRRWSSASCSIPTRKLLSIGYRVPRRRARPQLLRPARLRGAARQLRRDRQGRRAGVALVPARPAVTPVDRGSALISWSGSMFEYLMPALVMRAPPGSLLEQTDRFVVRRQIELRRGARRAVGRLRVGLQRARPRADLPVLELRRAGLGLKRGLERRPRGRAVRDGARGDGRSRRARRELRAARRRRRARRLRLLRGARLHAGRLPEGADVGIVRAYMAHHQGMTLVAIAQRRCTTARCGRASTPSRSCRPPSCCSRSARRATSRSRGRAPRRCRRRPRTCATWSARWRAASRRRTSAAPRTHLLSNGRYAVMLTAAGSGYSRWRDLAVTRWREDATRDAHGQYVFLRDADSGERLVGGLPAERRRAGRYEVGRSPRTAPRSCGATARSRRRSRSWSRPRTTPRCAASRSRTSASRTREIELTSYAEVVLAPPAADAAHPAFSNLFVADRVRSRAATRCSRRAARARAGGAAGLGGARRGGRRATRRRRRSTRPTARASSAAAAASARRSR